jgi:hypothetical protein
VLKKFLEGRSLLQRWSGPKARNWTDKLGRNDVSRLGTDEARH